MVFTIKNNVESSVVGTLGAGVTVLNVTPGEGANFPSAFPFRLTLWRKNIHPDPGDDSQMEIATCTGRTTDALTIIRGAEGTADVEHLAGIKYD